MGVGSAPRIKVEGLDLLVRVVRVVSNHTNVEQVRGAKSLVAQGVLHRPRNSKALHRPSPDLQLLSARSFVVPPIETKRPEWLADQDRRRSVVFRVELQQLGLRQVADKLRQLTASGDVE